MAAAGALRIIAPTHLALFLAGRSRPRRGWRAPHVNTDALIEQFDKIITQYGFSLDGAVPGTYADLLQRVWPRAAG